MNGVRQAWLVAMRELRERSRSGAFRVSLGLMVVTVAAMIVLPAVLTSTGRNRDVGLAGTVPSALQATIQAQGEAVGITAQVHGYASVAAGEAAVRRGDADVLVVDARRLEWPRVADEKLKAVVTGAIQLVAVRERAAAAGIDPDRLLGLLAPVSVSNVELSAVAGRTSADQTATVVMSGLLLFTMSIYGGLVLSGVVEEKSSRVVEVLLARIPPRSLLAGKVAGIGLLGLFQVGLTAVAALIAVTAVGSLDITAIRGAVLAWTVLWFLLGYVLYATLYGAVGSLASRPEDAQSVAAPSMMVMVGSYLAAFTMIGQPDSPAMRAISFFPTTAPIAMPERMAMGAPAWWEVAVSLVVVVATIAGLVRLGGRLYASAVLHSGPALSLRDAWRAASAEPRTADRTPARRAAAWLRRTRTLAARRTTMAGTTQNQQRVPITVLTLIGVALGVVVGLLTSDVILGVIAGAGFIAVTVQMVRLWTGHGGPTASRA